jgi:hypothetical protein
MTVPPRSELQEQGNSVTIEHQGRELTGTFVSKAGRIIVHSASGKSRSRKAGARWGSDTLLMIAASILREMAQEGDA